MEYTDYVRNISAPVLLIQGENDVYGSLKQLDAIESDLKVECSRLVLGSTGHSPHKEQPERVLHALKIFIRTLINSAVLSILNIENTELNMR